MTKCPLVHVTAGACVLQGAKSPLLWEEGQVDEYLRGSPVQQEVRSRLQVCRGLLPHVKSFMVVKRCVFGISVEKQPPSGPFGAKRGSIDLGFMLRTPWTSAYTRSLPSK